MREFLPLTRYLSEVLKDAGVYKARIVVAGSIFEMAGLMRDGKVDLHLDSAFPCMATSALTAGKFLLGRWKRGLGEYRSVIFARKGNGLARLADLKGKIIALGEPFSSTGYFFPKLALVQAGLKPAEKRQPSDTAAANEVGYVFSNADENTLAWVVRGRVSAGATHHQSYAPGTRHEMRLRIADQLIVIATGVFRFASLASRRFVFLRAHWEFLMRSKNLQGDRSFDPCIVIAMMRGV
jgi:phosphonate transport system substrate-binding protein